MTLWADEAELRNWLVDYLVTTIGCSPEEIGLDAPLNELGVGSRHAVVLAGELSELLGRTVSPVDFWQNPTVNALAHSLINPDVEPGASAGPAGSLTEPIAVIGMGCRLPGDIRGPDSFMKFLSERRSAISVVPDGRWDEFDDGTPEARGILNRTTKWGAFLDEVAAFDAEYFDISPSEADQVDPQQRLLLEVAVEALDHAGIPAESLQRSQTGVFAGACSSEYGFLVTRDLSRIDPWTGTGGSLSIIANRLSYFLDARGPSVTVDTACSSSLVAIHLACRSLRLGESDLALAAGVNLMLSPIGTRSFDVAEAMSQSGACRSFDAGADGFVRGEGCGVVVLKRLSEALHDGNRILAVVRGSAMNQDGRSNGLMAPNPAAQTAVLRAACADAGIEPHEVDYVEAHGTGTLLGDPIEARGLGSVYGRGRAPDAPLLIGSVKSSVGHLEAAAGVVGFIKATLAIQSGRIPANLHFDAPNPHIPFDELRLKVVDKPTTWPSTGRPRRAGVSSFGFGGTNAHLVLEQSPAPATTPLRVAEAPVTTLVLCGKTAQRAALWAGVLADWMAGPGALVPLADIAHTVNHHRARHAQFGTVVARNRDDAIAGLRALAAGESGPGVVGPHVGSCLPGVVFVYSGQGSQWVGMGRRLLVDEPVFAAAVDELEPEFVDALGFSLRDVIADAEPVEGSVRVQSVIFGMQLALTALWRSYGVEPDAVVGHSLGEITAAVVSGALTVADGLRVVAVRSRLMAGLADKGAVALLELDADAAESLIAGFAGVSVSVFTSPRQTVVAGPAGAVDGVIEAARAANVFARRVNMEVASHTAMMDPILDELRTTLADLMPGAPRIPVFTTVEDAGTPPVFDAKHWVANVRNPVRFSQAIAAAAADHATFVEVSPHPVLTRAIADTLGASDAADSGHRSFGTLERDSHDTVAFHTALSTVRSAAASDEQHPAGRRVDIPLTPWQHTRYWIDTEPATAQVPGAVPRRAPADNGLIPADWLYEPTWRVRPLPVAGTAPHASWHVIASPELSTELGGVALEQADHVLFAPDAGTHLLDVESAYDLFNEAKRVARELIALPVPPRLYFLTRNAEPVAAGDRANPAHAVLWGLGRTLALEHPEIWGGVIDVDESVPAVLAARQVLAEALTGDGEDQVVYRAGARFVPRLQRRAQAAATALFSPNTSHLVIGATGHIGPQLISQLAGMGAGTIVAVSRNPADRLHELAQQLSTNGTRLITIAADATDATAMAALFDRFGTDLPSLEGVYLAAFAGGPVSLTEMTDRDVGTMFRPKLDALAVLHALTLRTPVRYFVLFSSISGLLGSRWLAHYTATSTFLDTFGQARRNLGLPATVVNWGLWKSLADGQSGARQVSSGSGLEPMADDVAIRALAVVLGPDAPAQSTVADADWPLLAAAYRTRGALRIVDEVLAEAATVSALPESAFRKSLRECAPEDRRMWLAEHISALASAVMGLPRSEILDPAAGFFQLGMDSLMSVALARDLGASLGEEITPAMIFDYPTVDALTDHLATMLPELADTASAVTDEYADLTDDELLQQLSERLGSAK